MAHWSERDERGMILLPRFHQCRATRVEMATQLDWCVATADLVAIMKMILVHDRDILSKHNLLDFLELRHDAIEP